MRRLYLFLAIILCAATAGAQTAKVTGKAVDQSGGVVLGADVTLLGPNNTAVATTKTGADGTFTMDAPPGSYALQVAVEGFDNSVQGISVGANNNRPITVTLAITKISQTVDVEETTNAITLDASNNQTALVLKEEDIQALPDDTDDLTQYLTDLAGPRAAAAGGVQFIVDGFLGGQLPPKDQIKEIRINTNPFTTEYSRSGFGRIEVITKPGTGKLRGNFNFNFRSDTLNATQFNAPTKLPYSRQNYQGNLSGPFIHDKLTMTLSAQRNDSFNTTTIKALVPDANGNINSFVSSITQPNLRQNFNSRGQYALNPNNTLNFNVEFQGNTRSNQGVGNTALESRASNSKQNQFGMQFRETAILSSRMVHDTRLEFTTNHSTTTPVNPGLSISVLDAFQTGGSSNQSDTNNRSVLFGDTLIFNTKRLTLKAGTQGDYYFNNYNNSNNFLGSYTFSSPANYVCVVNGICAPGISNTPSQFTINRGNPKLDVSQFEFGAFVQTDIPLGKRFLVSPGVRYQVQSHLSDYNNFDPRVSFSYQLNKTTVLRAGLGLFHQTFGIGTYQQLLQLDGTHQTQILIRNPSYPDPFAGGIESTIPVTLRTRSNNLVAPYTNNISGSLEKSLKSGAVVSVAYDYIRGLHVFRSRNINAPLPGTPPVVDPTTGKVTYPLLDPTKGNIYELESSAASTFGGLTFGYRTRIRAVNVNANYTFSRSYNDSDNAFGLPADNYNLHNEWGRSPDNQRHHFQASFNGRAPGNVQVNTQFQLYSGKPYNISTGFDDNHDNDINDRPLGLTRNSGEGPGLFNTSINISRTFSLVRGEKPPVLGAAGNRGGDGGFGGGGGGNRGGGGGGGSFGGGGRGGGGNRGGGGGGRGGGAAAGPTANFFVNVQNVLNHRNFNNPIGTMSSPLFGQSISAQQPRTVELGVRLNF